jgi:hypothetical protein
VFTARSLAQALTSDRPRSSSVDGRVEATTQSARLEETSQICLTWERLNRTRTSVRNPLVRSLFLRWLMR